MSCETGSSSDHVIDLINLSDKATYQRWLKDTDPSLEWVQDTYSRFVWAEINTLAMEQVQYPSEMVKLHVEIGANEGLVDYLESRGMIYYTEEERKERA